MYKIDDSLYIKDNYVLFLKNISIGGIIKSPEMIRFVLDHFKTKKNVLTCSY